ncbi:MAG TPA: hypothetical protein VGJ91_01690 [Polyangiaceae bacterium]|jgi:hypothetical protein
MLWLALGALSLALFALLAYRLPVSLSSNLQARAEPSGSWVLALGVGIGPLALSAIAAQGVKPFLTCHLFGKQVVRLPLARWFGRRAKPLEPEQPAPAAKPLELSRVERAIARFFKHLDPLETLLSWWEKERVFEVRSLELDVEYSFRDVALTGQILAGLCMLSGVLPDRYVINQRPGWHSEDRLALSADGRFRLWPVRLSVDVLGFVLKQRSLARHAAVPASE